jgi:hypothetical protein
VTDIWAYLGLCKEKLNISSMWKQEKEPEGEKSLMEIAFKNSSFSASEMKELNRFRIYLQAFFVSNITEINGKDISPWGRQGYE